MKQGRKSRCARALLSALAASAALVVAVPATAAATPAAIDEYDFQPPVTEPPQEPTPPTEPTPTTPVAPTSPTDPTAPVAPESTTGGEVVPGAPIGAVPEPERILDRVAARRDVLFEAPAEPPTREARTVAAPAEDGSLPPALWLLFGLGGVCIVATLLRLRRFAGSGGGIPRSQTSS